ncbi:MAG: hypothetical protein ACLQRH_29100 [Acidimicrobiales bacterium]
MTPIDRKYLASLLKTGLLKGPVLEVGSQAIEGQGGNTEAACRSAGLDWEGLDLVAGPGVDHLLDMTDTQTVSKIVKRWATVLLFNTLEHVYDPVTVLRNAVSLTDVGGLCVVITPVVWQIHDYPADYSRLLPDFYLEFARRERCTVVPSPTWLVGDNLIPVEDLTLADGQKQLPGTGPLAHIIFDRRRVVISRVVHKLFNTVGRNIHYPNCALGVVLRREA